MIATIAWHELKRLLLSPLAWVILAFIQFITALQFLNGVEDFMLKQPQLLGLVNPPGVSDWIVAPLFADVAFMLLMVVPVITMRSLSSERREKTMSLLISSPLSTTDIVLGKYLGSLLFLCILVGMITLMPLSLAFGTTLDVGKVFAGTLGLLLVLAAFAAAGLFISSLTNSPAVSAVGSFFFLFSLWLMFWISSGGAQLKALVEQLSLLHHFVPLLQGTINTSDVAYFVLFALTFLILTIRRLDAQRLQG